ncbi:lipoyl(octanoyl) transferase LipB [Rickettsia endosymbiont of Cardiosporidium cionae]|uniref:lipoyl(octanoyl) transferase LipB n=1 Tax=Rickettsia endosymbiont of Cardiosporidium cionae TaxID=2777155 RepID=UPI001893738F|nr:lipoyl(octanoyl) transferase LipB [Rickettsia endosymbiont of Cardiosporidium cionae]KAF8818591.1 octanoyltransferase [Rickettsia endosymbiont of Cardiosporidium cionae]
MIDWVHFQSPQKYQEIILLMEQYVEKIISKNCNDSIYLLEHEDIYTIGRGSNNKEEEIVNNSNTAVIKTNRGGKVTYHGPGQRIIYTIINLDNEYYKRDLKYYLYMIEKWMINTLYNYDVISYRLENHIGIWTKYKNRHSKLAFIGLRVRKWVVYHGIAVNINTDLTKFDQIIPCGMKNLSITSLQELNISTTTTKFDRILKAEFYKLFNFYQ